MSDSLAAKARVVAACLAAILSPCLASGATPCARVTSAGGNVSIYPSGRGERVRAALNVPVCEGAFVQTNHGRVEIDFPEGATLRIEAISEATITIASGGKPGMEVELAKGQVQLDAWGKEAPRLTISTEFGSVTPQTECSFTLSRTSESAVLDVESGVAEMKSSSYATLVSASQRLIMRHGNPLFAPPVASSDGGGRLRDDFAVWVARRREARGEMAEHLASSWDSYARELSGSGQFAPCEDATWCFRPNEAYDPPGDGSTVTIEERKLWVAREPWAWCTSHYGAWIRSRGSWAWIPGLEWSDGPVMKQSAGPEGRTLSHPLFDAIERRVKGGASPGESGRRSDDPRP